MKMKMFAMSKMHQNIRKWLPKKAVQDQWLNEKIGFSMNYAESVKKNIIKVLMVVKLMVCLYIQSELQIDLKKFMKIAADSGKEKYFETEFEFKSDRAERLIIRFW